MTTQLPERQVWQGMLPRIGLGLLAVASSASGPADPPLVLTDVTKTAGIDFVETIGDREMTNIVESAGVGCGFVDYDGDGRLDIYLVNGCWLDGLSNPELEPPQRARLAAATDRLYRNRGDGTFEDVTAKAGLARSAYGMGVVAADYDGDGDADIYVTNYGPNFLYRNNGNGTFTEVAKNAGVDDRGFGVGAVFFDYNRDGRLDLYVGNYLKFEPDPARQHSPGGVRSPLAYEGQQDHLYRGNADGTFTDVTQKAGIEISPKGRAMGVGAVDYDQDGWTDVFIANDAMENFLFHNNGDGTFEDQALVAGVAFTDGGDAAAAMAVEIGDYDNDGRFDIVVPDMNLCCLYRNLGAGVFEDLATRSGIAAAMTRLHSWGAALADFDLDGHLDLYISNGSTLRLEAHEDGLFVGDGDGRFVRVAAPGGSPKVNLGGEFVGRGVAHGDFDNDGDVDLLVANLNDRPMLLRNDTPRRGRHWITCSLIGRPPNRDAIGAVLLVRVGGKTLVRTRQSAGSYLSQHDPRLHVGLGVHDRVERLEVTWPDGSKRILHDVPADRQVYIRQRPERKD